jgi:hypothetical protein
VAEDYVVTTSTEGQGPALAPAEGSSAPAGPVEVPAGTERPEGSQPAAPEAHDAPGAAEEEEAQSPGRRRLERRFSTLSQQIREQQEHIAYLRGQNEAMARHMSGGMPQGAPEATDGTPQREQYASYEEYEAARQRVEVSRQVRAELDEQRYRAAQAQQVEHWAKRVAEYRTTQPDYDEVVGQSRLPLTPELRDGLMASEHGPQMAYHLAEHPELHAQVVALSGVRLGRALAWLEANVQSPPPAQAAPSAQPGARPRPLSPVQPSGAPPTVADPGLPYDEWVRLRRQELRRRG